MEQIKRRRGRPRKTPLKDTLALIVPSDAPAPATTNSYGPGRPPSITPEMVMALSDVLTQLSGDTVEEWRERFFPFTENLAFAREHRAQVEKIHNLLRRKYLDKVDV